VLVEQDDFGGLVLDDRLELVDDEREQGLQLEGRTRPVEKNY
jgi:hypothetical protein